MRTSVAFYLAEMNEITNEISYEERKTKSYRYFREFLKCDEKPDNLMEKARRNRRPQVSLQRITTPGQYGNIKIF